MADPTGNMPAFPTFDDSAITRTPEEDAALRAGMSSYGGAAGPASQFKDSYIAQRLGELHAQHVAAANRHFSNIQNYYYALDRNENPANGQPMTDDERQRYQQMLEGAWADMLKVPGLDRDMKAELQARQQLMQGLLTHGRERVAATALHLANAPQGPQAGMGAFPMPSPLDVPNIGARAAAGLPGSATAPQPQGPSAAPASPAGTAMPPLPQVMPGEMASTFTGPEVASQIQTNDVIAQRRAELLAAGVKEGSLAWQVGMQGGKPVAGASSAKEMIAPGGRRFYGLPTIGGTIDIETGEIVAGALPATTAEKSPPKVLVNQGIPTGLQYQGDIYTPDDKTKWASLPPDVQSLYNNTTSAHAQKVKEDTDRMLAMQDRYTKARGVNLQYNVWDRKLGMSHYVNANEMNLEPYRYTASTNGQQQANRAVALEEINNATQILDDAIEHMPEGNWDLADVAKLATALRDPDPEKARSTFFNELATSHLDDAQKEYVLAIMNARESVMRIGAIAGLGNGATDQMRTAIELMLPGGVTPSKEYAKRQVALTKQQFQIFGKSIPSEASLGIANGAGNFPVPGGMDNFTPGNYNVGQPPPEIASAITDTAKTLGVDPNLAMAVAHQESGFNNERVSSAGARGIFQLMPVTAKDMGVDPSDPHQNIMGGIKYLGMLLSRYNGNVPRALAAYDAGMENVDKAVAQYGDDFLAHLPKPEETVPYVQAITNATASAAPTAPGTNMPALPAALPAAPKAAPGTDLGPAQRRDGSPVPDGTKGSISGTPVIAKGGRMIAQ